jgi:hypothetical protein
MGSRAMSNTMCCSCPVSKVLHSLWPRRRFHLQGDDGLCEDISRVSNIRIENSVKKFMVSVVAIHIDILF